METHRGGNGGILALKIRSQELGTEKRVGEPQGEREKSPSSFLTERGSGSREKERRPGEKILFFKN